MAELLGAGYVLKDEILTPVKSGLIKQIPSVIRRLLFLPLRILEQVVNKERIGSKLICKLQ